MANVVLDDPLCVDLFVYSLWLRGSSIAQIATHRLQEIREQTLELEAPVSASDGAALRDLLLRDTQNKCNILEYVEIFLKEPNKLLFQLQLQLPPSVKLFMFHRYYLFDDTVIRELLGRKLTSRARKDLDEVAETTGIPLRSCRRQFDNLRRVFNFLDDRNFDGDLCLLVENHFQLPLSLAKRYVAIVFILYNRFTVQSNKRKTAFLTTADFEYLSKQMLIYWVQNLEFVRELEDMQEAETHSLASPRTMSIPDKESVSPKGDLKPTSPVFGSLSAQPSATKSTLSSASKGSLPVFRSGSIVSYSKIHLSATSFDIDPVFTSKLRDVKSVLVGSRSVSEAMLKRVLRYVKEAKYNESKISWVENRYRFWLRSLVGIGSGLAQAKELRDLFDDVLTNVADPLRELKLSKDEITALFDATAEAGVEFSGQTYAKEWSNFVLVISKITLMALRVA